MTVKPDALDTARALFADPPRENGLIPFWFWNDDITEEGLLEQLEEFYERGFGGFIPHARTGLTHRVGYLSEEFFKLVKTCVKRASELGMKVVLYDEGGYPSGSAVGQVVAENPDYANKCLIPVKREIEGPASGYWRPNSSRALCNKLIAVVQGRLLDDNTLDPDSLTELPILEHDIVHYDVPEGRWLLLSAWQVFSGATIRGVHAEQEDAHATAPAAGDILSPEAVAAFIRITHDAYYENLKEYFGTTVLAMFTDEPGVMGRGTRYGRMAQPFTTGFMEDIKAVWGEDAAKWLPVMWYDCGPKTEELRAAYDRAVYDRLERVFYKAQSEWCVAHGIALTGHPAESNELGSLRLFQWPGQDMVWNYVEPNNGSGLEGIHSIAPKGASSAAALASCERNTSEVLGAYGWKLTLDEAKWLFDWHIIRGNNLFYPHAFFYTIRDRRAWESEPALGRNNVWWPYWEPIADHVRRLCWLTSGGKMITDVAILGDSNHLGWEAAKALYQSQIDFCYVDETALKATTLANGRALIGDMAFRVIIVDGAPMTPALRARLDELSAAGLLVIENWQEETLAKAIVAFAGADLAAENAPDLRMEHYRKDSLEYYILFNEGEAAIDTHLCLRATGKVELWLPYENTTAPCPAEITTRGLELDLHIERRQIAVLAVDPAGVPSADAPRPVTAGDVLSELTLAWKASCCGKAVELPCPGDWAQVAGWELFTGSVSFEAILNLASDLVGQPLYLDLGQVGDIAEVSLDGKKVGACSWTPYVFKLGSIKAGEHQLCIKVTNSMANEYEGVQLPSGILGPVSLRAERTL